MVDLLHRGSKKAKAVQWVFLFYDATWSTDLPPPSNSCNTTQQASDGRTGNSSLTAYQNRAFARADIRQSKAAACEGESRKTMSPSHPSTVYEPAAPRAKDRGVDALAAKRSLHGWECCWRWATWRQYRHGCIRLDHHNHKGGTFPKPLSECCNVFHRCLLLGCDTVNSPHLSSTELAPKNHPTQARGTPTAVGAATPPPQKKKPSSNFYCISCNYTDCSCASKLLDNPKQMVQPPACVNSEEASASETMVLTTEPF